MVLKSSDANRNQQLTLEACFQTEILEKTSALAQLVHQSSYVLWPAFYFKLIKRSLMRLVEPAGFTTAQPVDSATIDLAQL